MSYSVSIKENKGYIQMEVSGERTKGQEAKAAIELWVRLAEECNNKGIFKVLAIYSLSGELPTMAAYEVGVSLAKNELIKKLKIAVVDLNENSRINNLFTETVAKNRVSGMYGGKVFYTTDKAIEWLLAEKS